jgi:hypothetical protein
MLYRLLTLLGLLAAAPASAQVWRITDTVQVCTGSTYAGAVIGRDSLLVTDTLAGANGPDTLVAVWVQALPTYGLIRDTTMRRGGMLLGLTIWQNQSVNQVGQTVAGCDSNITWVVYFNPEPPPPAAGPLRWKATLYPNPTAGPVTLALSPQSRLQAADAYVQVRVSDRWGRQRLLEVPSALSEWSENAGIYRFSTAAYDWPDGMYFVEIQIDGNLFVFPLAYISDKN